MASGQRLSAERPIYGTQKLFARSRPTSAPRAPSDVPRRDHNVRSTSIPAVSFAQIPVFLRRRGEGVILSRPPVRPKGARSIRGVTFRCRITPT